MKQEENPVYLIENLFKRKLITSASIDENNETFTFENGKMIKEIYSVITAKTNSLLFNEIANFIEKQLGSHILINSIPIIASNKKYIDLIASKIITT